MWNRLRFLNGTWFSSEVVPTWRSIQHGKALVQGVSGAESLHLWIEWAEKRFW